ncbi:MAG: VIT domain-containing protein, partial [Myxococcota bacterium]|nr:VIT domain-containing protein [Myxococcota bacterium]
GLSVALLLGGCPTEPSAGPNPGSGSAQPLLQVGGTPTPGSAQPAVAPGPTVLPATKTDAVTFVSKSLKLSEPAPAAAVPDKGPAAAPAGSRPLQMVRREPPLSLTASDGTGLRLVALKAQAVVEEPLAFTELQLAFENPENRTIEGNFRITLPQGATISRFAMKLGDRWQEGEVLERQLARRVYEDFLHRRQDPALLEQQAGNEFSARVFPIPPRGVKELIVSYSQELVRDTQPYAIPLQGLPELGSLELRVMLSKGEAGGAGGSSLGGALLTSQLIEVKKERWTPDVDFTVPQAHTADRLGLRHENLVVARITPLLEAQPQEIASLFILVDTSASRMLGFGKQLELVGKLVRGLADGAGPATPVAVAAYDQEVMPIFTGKAGDFGEAQLRKLAERLPLGASDLNGALRWLGQELGKTPGTYERVILVTDGVATAGEVEGDKLGEAARGLAQGKVQRLDVLAVGGIRDDATLARLVTAGLGQDGAVIEADQPLAEIGRRLTQATRSRIQVAVEGAAWVWPQQLDGVQAGDQVLVYADLPVTQPFALSLNGVAVAADRRSLAKVERPLLERAWIKARMARIQHQRDTVAANDPDLREALRKQVIDLSTKYRVLSPYTALLVLETEWDYQRYQIDRNALADILTIGPAGITVVNRSATGILQPVTVQTGTTSIATTPVRPPAGAKREPARPSRAREGEREGAMRKSAARAAEGEQERARSFAGDTRRAQAAEGEEEADRSGALRDAVATGGMPASRAEARDSDDGAAAAPPSDQVVALEAPPAAAPAPSAPPTATGALGLRGAGMGGGGSSGVGGLGGPGAAPPRAEPVLAERAPSLDSTAAPPPPPERLVERTAAEQPAGGVLQILPGRRPPAPPQAVLAKPAGVSPYTGTFQEVMEQLAKNNAKAALKRATDWLAESPGDVMALIALGESFEALDQDAQAARAYGSLIDLFPSRADMRRFAGARLERVSRRVGLGLALDTYRKAVEQRPDHPASHRLYAFALLAANQPQEAVQALLAGLRQRYPDGRFLGATRILREDLALAVAAWQKAAPDQAATAQELLRSQGISAETEPSLRFVLVWETDANDVDFHIYDGRGGHAYYQARTLPSGGELYADVTTGYGPECFTIRRPPKQRAYPYKLQAHYYSRGPMGYGMGKLQVVEHDGQGGLKFDERPFVVMQDQAYVDLGTVKGAL